MCLFLIITQLLTHGTHTGTTHTGQIPPTYKHTHKIILYSGLFKNTHVDL